MCFNSNTKQYCKKSKVRGQGTMELGMKWQDIKGKTSVMKLKYI